MGIAVEEVLRKEFQLRKDRERPVLKIPVKKGAINILIDTGALYPVWCGSAELLESLFDGVEKEEGTYVHLSGFGGEGEYVPVYRIKAFALRQERAEVVYENLQIAVSEDKSGIGVDMVLCVGMLNAFGVFLELKRKQITLCGPNRVLYVIPRYLDLEKLKNLNEVTDLKIDKVLTSVTVLMQSEEPLQKS